MPTDLLPEVVGLAVTPAAVAGCILLLETKRPVAVTFLVRGATALAS